MLNTNLVLNKSIKLNADKTKVWNALVNPEKIKIYLFGTETLSDWKEGSPIIFQGEWEGKKYQDKGTILKLTLNEVFEYNYWSSFSTLEDIPDNYSVISFKLSESEGGTILDLTQKGFEKEENKEHSEKSWDFVIGLFKELVEAN